MEKFIEKLDSLLDNDPFADLDATFLSTNDFELIEKYRVKYVEDRQRIRNERKTKSFEEIMDDLLHELSVKPDLSSLSNCDTSADEQDELDPSKSIGHSVTTDELQTSTRVVYPIAKSPSIPTERKLSRYAEQSRRNTFTLENECSSSSSSSTSLPVVRPPEYVRLNSEGFDPQHSSENILRHVKDARSTFSIPKSSPRITRQEAQTILQRKLPAFIKGHLTRQLFRTDHVKRLIQTLNDTKKFAVEFQTQCFQTKTKLDPEDIQMIDQLIKQVEAVLNEIHSIFTQYSPARRVAMILRHSQTQQMQTIRMHQRMTKVIHRPIIDPSPPPPPPAAASTDTIPSRPKTSNQQHSEKRSEPVRRHVTNVRPVTKNVSSVQRKSRTTTTTKTNLPARSSSAIVRPPPRLAPSSPLFRNRPK